MIENEGFNTQKQQGYPLEHLYSKDYQGFKNHYYLIQIGHMISQILEAWKGLWKGVKQSREQKHRRLLESLKRIRIREEMGQEKERFQIRFIIEETEERRWRKKQYPTRKKKRKRKQEGKVRFLTRGTREKKPKKKQLL